MKFKKKAYIISIFFNLIWLVAIKELYCETEKLPTQTIVTLNVAKIIRLVF